MAPRAFAPAAIGDVSSLSLELNILFDIHMCVLQKEDKWSLTRRRNHVKGSFWNSSRRIRGYCRQVLRKRKNPSLVDIFDAHAVELTLVSHAGIAHQLDDVGEEPILLKAPQALFRELVG